MPVSQVSCSLLTPFNDLQMPTDYPHEVTAALISALISFREAIEQSSSKHGQIPLVVVLSAQKQVAELFEDISQLAKVVSLN